MRKNEKLRGIARCASSATPHLNIPQPLLPHLSSPSPHRRKITQYFHNMYPEAIKKVSLCENVQYLEKLIQDRTKLLAKVRIANGAARAALYDTVYGTILQFLPHITYSTH